LSDTEAVAAFYKTHPITIYVGSTPEGGYSVYAQTLARHLGRHLPGNPEIKVAFRGERAGFVLTNELYNSLPRDGTAIGGIRSANCVESVLNPSDEVKFDCRKFNWVGCVSRQNGTIITWHTSDVKTIEDARKREVVVGAEAPESNVGTLPNILNGLLGTKFRTVHNYTRAGLKKALESGEVESICGLGYNTLLAAHSDWLEGKKLNILAHTGLEPDPLMPGVPCTIEFARNDEDRDVIRMMDYRQVMGRPYAAPPGVPADRLAALQKAFQETMKDPAFIADAKKNHMLIDPLGPEKMARIVTDAYAIPKKVVARTWDMLKGMKD
jgi:hypothetical protein